MYHLHMTLATAKRILLQISHDHRTIALMLVAPIMLMSLLHWMFSDTQQVFDTTAPALLGIFPFVIMFLVTSIATLRERTGGTMERLMTMPIGKFDIIAGYGIAFTFFGILQSVITSTFAIYALDMSVPAPQWFVVLIAAANTILGVALGLLVSAFARTEFQAVQFMPVFILPQILICGLFVPLDALPSALETLAHIMPLTYAVDALNLATTNSEITSDMWGNVWIVSGFIVGAIMLASLTLRRRTG